MTINEIKARLGAVDSIEIAQATCSKTEALTKITSEIEKNGLDVDDQYLEFLRKLETTTVEVDVKYFPVYYTTSIAKLSWKEKKTDQEATDHQEFVRFNSLFYKGQNLKKNRLNNIEILKVLDKKSLKMNEQAVTGQIDTNTIDSSIRLLGMEGFEPQVIMDAPLQEGEYYPLDNQYVLGQSEIEAEVQKSLEKTKSYKRLQKQTEKWSNIEQITMTVVLVPIASIKIGNHDQIVNCANGEMDVQYEVSKTITSDLKKTRWLVFPSIAVLTTLLVIIGLLLLFKTTGPVIFEGIKNKSFCNFNGWIWLISLVFGGVFSVIAIPSRKSIVRRKTDKKNYITLFKIFAVMIYAIDYSLLILLFTIIQYIIAK